MLLQLVSRSVEVTSWLRGDAAVRGLRRCWFHFSDMQSRKYTSQNHTDTYCTQTYTRRHRFIHTSNGECASKRQQWNPPRLTRHTPTPRQSGGWKAKKPAGEKLWACDEHSESVWESHSSYVHRPWRLSASFIPHASAESTLTRRSLDLKT